MNDLLTPLSISQENSVDFVPSEYNWEEQTGMMSNASPLGMSTSMGLDTSTASHSGNDVWSDDSDTD